MSAQEESNHLATKAGQDARLPDLFDAPPERLQQRVQCNASDIVEVELAEYGYTEQLDVALRG